jgi:FlaA1/EpsC-like NDP-sugar epimerase
VAKFGPAKILILDCAETPLYYLEKELVERWPKLMVVPLIADIRSFERIDAIFGEFLPQVVFHAAAYKHVPMMEYNPVEAVFNNIGGTRNLADVANQYGVANFVMISTDKAVNPTNVMGASKRAAELYVQSLARTCEATNFTTVRFGNVLGSNGSVIPLFKEQILKGGPVTVTDPKVTRYFMTIPEASQLVLQAGCIGKGGEIFLLDMGQPVRILDLAEEMIRLSGLEPYDDIDIVFSGLRPGEKMYEELLVKGEGIKPTVHEKIKVLEGTETDLAAITAELEELFAAALNSDIPQVMRLFRKIVPEFTPTYSFPGKAPAPFQRLRPDLFPKRDLKLVSGK